MFYVQIYVTRGLCQHYLHDMATHTQSYEKVLPADMSVDSPSYACLLGNLLEAVGVALARPACPYDMVHKCIFFLFVFLQKNLCWLFNYIILFRL